MPPQAEAVPHPTVKGGWTVRDILTPKGAGLFVSKQSAEMAAAARNKHRRQK